METKNGIKILVVDDEEHFRDLVTVWFEARGYVCLLAANGQEAIKIVKEKKPDVAFVDFRMPGMDGIETIKAIRQFDKEIPIIVVSSYLEDPRAGQMLKLSVSGIFHKDKDFSEGLKLLETVLRVHKKLKK